MSNSRSCMSIVWCELGRFPGDHCWISGSVVHVKGVLLMCSFPQFHHVFAPRLLDPSRGSIGTKNVSHPILETRARRFVDQGGLCTDLLTLVDQLAPGTRSASTWLHLLVAFLLVCPQSHSTRIPRPKRVVHKLSAGPYGSLF